MDRIRVSAPQGRLRLTRTRSSPSCDQRGQPIPRDEPSGKGSIQAAYGRFVLPAWTAASTLIGRASAVHDAAPGAAECYQHGQPAMRRHACYPYTPIPVAWTPGATSVDIAEPPVAARHPASPGARFAHSVLPAWTLGSGGGPLARPGAGATSVDRIDAATSCAPGIPACYHCGHLTCSVARPPRD